MRLHLHDGKISSTVDDGGFPGGLKVKNLPAVEETWVRSPGGGGHGNPLQYSCLENSMDRGAWWAAVHRDTKSET